MTVPLPPATIWEQFAVIAVIMLVLIFLGVGILKGFREFTKWQSEQANQRETEREKQRLWEENRDTKLEAARKERDKSWQDFFERINGENSEAICQQTEVTKQLVEQIKAVVPGIEAIMTRLSEHDNWAHKVIDEGQVVVRKKKTP
jgi:flagellar biosynthesis/type III secretory pathway M-ring protein FliF/YscJ